MPSCNPAAFSDAPRSFREHHYETADPIETVSAPGYFAAAVSLLAPGDLVKVRAGVGGRIDYREFLVVRVRPKTGDVTVLPVAGATAAPSLPQRHFPKTRQQER